ncbi:LuxR C-terminal-related transcriptional regulator [Paraburkholderia sp. J63]|uniref:LuxR C-terminal-related transcriptional regulator n=1 Tax=Paraburkholderia sp. J63 TaxID=2805434 RepID=UPI002ABD33C4|nr:LuxR C-terminal-related transcriptional regulator [Paraburkholderia sp. J63]
MSESTESTIWTKLVPPPDAAGQLLAREHLAGKFAGIGSKRLTLVCAPAGYGKTSVLVAAFAKLKAAGAEPGWISLDHDDNDLARFLAHWCSAARLEPLRASGGAAQAPRAPVRAPQRLLASEFVGRLQALERASYLFLDDYHLVSDSAIVAFVNELLHAPVDRLHLVIAARDAKTLNLARLRLNDQLQTIEAGELSLSAAETKALVARVGGIDASPAQIGRIREKTEGWAAGVQLAAIAMRGRQDAAQVLETFSGEHASVADYLADEVFRQQPAAVQDFLLATSILARFDISLAAAVSGRADAGDLLEKLERENLFVFSLDDERRWHRYHHLFSDFLRRKLREAQPDLEATLHERACTWFDARGHAVESIGHAFAAGQMLRAAQLLDHYSQRLIAGARTAELMSFTSRLPAWLLDQMPGALLDQAWHLIACWRFGEARVMLERVARIIAERSAFAASDEQREEVTFLGHKLAHRELILAVTRDDLALTRTLASAWLAADTVPDPVMRATASSIAAQAGRESYQYDGVAAAAATALRERFASGGGYFSLVYHECVCGAAFFARGEFAAAEQGYRRAQEMAVELHGEYSALSAFPAALSAELHYERNEPAQAAQLLRTHPMTAEFGLVDKLVAGFVTRSRLASLQGRLDEAGNALDDAAYFAAEYGFERLRAHVLNERVRLLIASGEAKAASRLLTQPGGPAHDAPIAPCAPQDGVTTVHELYAMAHARAWIANGRAGDAIALLRPWLVFCRGRHSVRSTIRLSMLLAAAYLRDGNRLAAQRTLVEALKAGERGPFIRAYLDENAEAAQALSGLGAVAAAQYPFDRLHLQAVLAAREGKAPAAAQPAVVAASGADTVREQMSGRELQIIRLAAQGLPNGDIASSMCLAESTVKWYWQRIFDKLDVRRRVDAVKQARERHWIR